MRRRPFSLFAIAWLLAAGVLVGVTVGSYWRAGELRYGYADFGDVGLIVEKGNVYFISRWFSLKNGVGFKCDLTEPLLMEYFRQEKKWMRGFDVSGWPRGRFVAVPIWFFTAICVGLAWWAQRRHRTRLLAMSEGRCIACGYDLRATPGRCPECGKAAVNESVVGS